MGKVGVIFLISSRIRAATVNFQWNQLTFNEFRPIPKSFSCTMWIQTEWVSSLKNYCLSIILVFFLIVVELVIGLTDRVVRTYQWINTKLVGLNKWEFANQIGTVGINDMANRTPSLLVAHPGGIYLKIFKTSWHKTDYCTHFYVWNFGCICLRRDIYSFEV